VNAARVRSVGAGRFLAPADVTPEAVEREAALLLGDPVYRLNAGRLQAEIAAMPGPEKAVGLLERLARDGQPLEVRPGLDLRPRTGPIPALSDPRPRSRR
jgi:UDP:flavonoid glycosyltransferase YjiC (YdhE family)